MRLLCLIRHAQFDFAERGVQDRDRPLDTLGQQQASEMARRLALAGLEPDRLISSSARRAHETAQALVDELGLHDSQIESRDDLYHASRQRLIGCLRALDDSLLQVAIVGHHPGLTELATFLTDGRVLAIPYGGVVRMELEVADWSQVRRSAALQYYADDPAAST